jgi:hypothetical protein
MSIINRETELFEKWSAERPGFVKDGVVDEKSYLDSSLKIMFVLKEINGSLTDWDNDLRNFIRQGARRQTWNNVTRWIRGIREINHGIEWKELEEISGEKRKEYLKSICAVNLKKSPGGHTTDNNALSQVAKDDEKFLNEQFGIYNPDLVICCGSIVSRKFLDLVKLPEKSDYKMTTRGICYHEYQTNKYMIEYSHPEARVANCLLHYGLVDAIREILKID